MYYYYNSDRSSQNISDIEVNGELSINYLDGKKFDINGEDEIKFSITNNNEKIKYYTINFSKVRGEGKYKLLFNDTLVSEGDLKTSDEINTDYLSIDAMESKTYTLKVTSEGNVKGIIGIRNNEEKNVTFADLILKDNKVSTASLTKISVEPAILNEGLIKSIDDIGVSYYFRGSVTNNYVNFANNIWRIVRINGDGTVRMILDNETPTISSYYNSDVLNFNFTDSTIYQSLNIWFEDNLNDYADFIANSKYCNDISHDDSNTYNASTRIMINNIPALTCLGTVVRSNIGLLSIDEVILAGASTKNENQSYYLYNSSISNVWYTMTAYSGNDSSMKMFMVDVNGKIKTDIDGNLNRGVRPVINLIKNIDMTGDGTETNPYRINDNE